ncbi:L,D-transpeptidase [Roseiarcaceae bacterium H3SJ34-1]|uniref:L,D-transpeptidase n=1 Tax=Terripilifer ovatus TaxID=3032367 RepID=UPI003AB96AD5|nr:L,D-transpeptidase [Roseiarcaceae bacterium H3SJ34-1]
MTSAFGILRNGETRRNFLKIGAGATAALTVATPALAAHGLVRMPMEYPAGTMVISLRQRQLFFILGDGMAMRYPVAVGKAGKAWSGWAQVNGKYVNPDWAPPAVVKHDNPRLPNLIRGGAPNNPMGVRALTLNLSEIAIHGTAASMRASIGSAASYGCIRMLNEDIIDLYDRVSIGTPVVAI